MTYSIRRTWRSDLARMTTEVQPGTLSPEDGWMHVPGDSPTGALLHWRAHRGGRFDLQRWVHA